MSSSRDFNRLIVYARESLDVGVGGNLLVMGTAEAARMFAVTSLTGTAAIKHILRLPDDGELKLQRRLRNHALRASVRQREYHLCVFCLVEEDVNDFTMQIALNIFHGKLRSYAWSYLGYELLARNYHGRLKNNFYPRLRGDDFWRPTIEGSDPTAFAKWMAAHSPGGSAAFVELPGITLGNKRSRGGDESSDDTSNDKGPAQRNKRARNSKIGNDAVDAR